MQALLALYTLTRALGRSGSSSSSGGGSGGPGGVGIDDLAKESRRVLHSWAGLHESTVRSEGWSSWHASPLPDLVQIGIIEYAPSEQQSAAQSAAAADGEAAGEAAEREAAAEPGGGSEEVDASSSSPEVPLEVRLRLRPLDVALSAARDHWRRIGGGEEAFAALEYHRARRHRTSVPSVHKIVRTGEHAPR